MVRIYAIVGLVAALFVGSPSFGQAATSRAAHAVQSRIVTIAIQDAGTATSFIVGLSSPTPFKVAARVNPDRVELDFPALEWPAAIAPSGTGSGLITVYRQGTLPGGGTRMVLETTGPIRITSAGTGLSAPGKPTQFMLTLVSADGSATGILPLTQPATSAAAMPVVRLSRPALAQSPQGESKPEAPPDGLAEMLGEMHEAPDVKPQRKPVRISRRIIAIDPGHGGIDPGTASADGVWEKTLTLQTGLALETALEATGRYTVVMTRGEDRFVELPERVKLARAAGAELFISLHCDAMEGKEAHGATVYTLSQNASDNVSDRLARQENRAAAIGGVDLATQDDGVATTLINLSMRESLNQSNRFAELLVGDFAEHRIGLQELKPHRSAGFAVLKAADMPSVLIEMGYLSNPHDAEELADPRHQALFASAVTAGVERYFRAGHS